MVSASLRSASRWRIVGFGDLVRRLGLADLLDDFAILDLGDHLAAAHAIAQLDDDRREPAAGLRRDIDGRFANQIADDAEMRGDVAARDFGHFDGHRRPEAAAGSAEARRHPGRRDRHRRRRRLPRLATARPAWAWPGGRGRLLALDEPEIGRGAGDGHHESR